MNDDSEPEQTEITEITEVSTRETTFEITFGPRTRFLLDLACGIVLGFLAWLGAVFLFTQL